MRPESSFWIVRNDVIVKYFDVFFVPLVKFNYWSKFHVNIITGSGVMTLSFYKRLTRNPEIGNIPVWVLPNIWNLKQARNTKFGTNGSIKMLLKAAKYQGYSFNGLWVIKVLRYLQFLKNTKFVRIVLNHF